MNKPKYLVKVNKDNPIGRKKLAKHLASTYIGRLPQWITIGLASTMACSVTGSVQGHWGEVHWEYAGEDLVYCWE